MIGRWQHNPHSTKKFIRSPRRADGARLGRPSPWGESGEHPDTRPFPPCGDSFYT